MGQAGPSAGRARAGSAEREWRRGNGAERAGAMVGREATSPTLFALFACVGTVQAVAAAAVIGRGAASGGSIGCNIR